jgi:hypothetical protein
MRSRRYGIVLGLLVAASFVAACGAKSPATGPAKATETLPAATGSLGQTATPAPIGLAHFAAFGLKFDYPASWLSSDCGAMDRAMTYLGCLGTGSASATCPQPGQCQVGLRVSLGQVEIEFTEPGGPPRRPDPIDPAKLDQLEPGDEFATVGGLPAIFHGEQVKGSTVFLGWSLSIPGDLVNRLGIDAMIVAPGVDEMRAEVNAVVASIRYDPPPPVLDPADGPGMLAVGLALARADEPYLSCFPDKPGASAIRDVTEVPGYGPLEKPLSVVCTSKIEAVPAGFWKLTLTESWTAASDRSAGSLSRIVWLTADGRLTATDLGPLPSNMPYLPPAP